MASDKQPAVILIPGPPDPRMSTRIELEKKIYDLHLIYWDRFAGKGLNPPKEEGFHLHIIDIEGANDPLKRIIPYLRFATEVRRLLKHICPHLIDVQGLDLLRIAMKYKNKHSKKVRIIYEVADLHKLVVDKQVKPVRVLAQKYLRHLDKKFCKKIDLLLVTSGGFINSYFEDLISSDKIMEFPNVFDSEVFNNYRKKESHEPFVVGYMGGIRYKKQIKNLLFAAQISGINVLIAGFETDGNEIEALCDTMPNVEWYGKFDYENQIADLYEKCDMAYCVYDADMANVKMALPNKLYQSIFCEVPIIVARSTYLAELVEKWGVGVVVDYKEPNELENMLNEFKSNPELLKEYEANCRAHKDICNLEYYNNKLKEYILSWVIE